MLDDLLATEDAAYAQFETALLGKLRGWRRVQGTTTLTLPAYLATSPHGDERPVVDPLTRDILLCLGYENEHIAYNESLLRGFPDYQVRLSSIPGNTVFIVENKATNIGDFTATRGDDSESPLAQLQRYVLASGSYARLGLLCNGRVLEGWEIGIGERHLLFQLDLVRLASGGELLEVDRETMRGLFLRCARVFFEGTESLLNDAVRSVHLSDEDVRAIWDECAAERDLDRLRTARAERMEAVWRKSARSAKEHADAVVRTLEQLIALLEADVRSELEAALSSSFEATRRIDAEPTILPEALATKLRLHRSLFNLDEARYSEALLQPLERYFEDPGRYNAAELIENLARRSVALSRNRTAGECWRCSAGNSRSFGEEGKGLVARSHREGLRCCHAPR